MTQRIRPWALSLCCALSIAVIDGATAQGIILPSQRLPDPVITGVPPTSPATPAPGYRPPQVEPPNSGKKMNRDVALKILAVYAQSGRSERLQDAVVFLASLKDDSLTFAYLANADLSGVDFNGADLSGSTLAGANLTDAHLKDANLTSANLIDANLKDAILEGANLKGANVNGAEFAGTNIQNANLDAINPSPATIFCTTKGTPAKINDGIPVSGDTQCPD